MLPGSGIDSQSQDPFSEILSITSRVLSYLLSPPESAHSAGVLPYSGWNQKRPMEDLDSFFNEPIFKVVNQFLCSNPGSPDHLGDPGLRMFQILRGL